MTYTVLVAGDPADYTLGTCCASGFEALGHDVKFVDITTNVVPVVHFKYGISEMYKRFLRSIRETDPDIVFIMKGNSLSTNVLERAQAESSAIFCNWNPDNPFMARSNERRLETYLDTLPMYDHAFIWTEALFERLAEAGARNLHHLPFAYNPEIHHPVDPDPAFRSDVVFAGHWSKKRQRFLSAVAELDVDLAIYGNYWKRKCFDLQLRRCVRDSAVFGENYCKAFCSSKIAINIVADHNLDAYNMRSFEIPATGSFMATTRTYGQEKIFEEGEGMACFDTPKELRNLVMKYLDSAERKAISKKGKERVEPHTYRARMETVISAIEETC